MPVEKEQQTISKTGANKTIKLARFSLIPRKVLWLLAEHYGKLGGKGDTKSRKYEEHNWRKGYPWSKSYDALHRHLSHFWGGEDIDKDTGSYHLISVIWHATTLLVFSWLHKDYDDRVFEDE